MLGLDNSGLSDPFAKIFVGESSRTTQVIEENLSPTWDQLLVVERLLVYGRKEDIKRRPPLVTVEIYDYDKVS